MTYTLFHGAKKNVGDFLIRDRARQLLIEHCGVSEDEIREFEMVYERASDEILSEVRKTDAVVLAGGPAYQERFCSDIYPSIKQVLDEGVPVYPLGPGWYGTDEDSYTFSSESKQLLERIHDRIKFSGVRDPPTKRVMERHGIRNVEMVGCPAWYDLDRQSSKPHRPSSVDSIAVSTVVPESEYYRNQFKYLLKRVTEEFPDADWYCSFHRGINADEYTPEDRAVHLKRFQEFAKQRGYEVRNTAYSSDNLEFYRSVDIHVGYRVHGHIYFLAQKHPSYLLQVDGRGTGASEGLKTPSDVQAFDRSDYEQPVDEIIENIQTDSVENFENFKQVDEQIETKYKDMQRLLSTLP